MPTARISIPSNCHPTTVTLSYLDRGGTSDIGYLQRLRSMVHVQSAILQAMEQRYSAGLAFWPHKLAAYVDAPVAAVVSPPSSHPELTTPYRAALKAKFPSAVDLTDRFARTAAPRAGEGASVADLIAATMYRPQGDEAALDAIVIVDDVVAAGRTAAALIALLRAAGMPDTATIRIAAPLWLPSS